MNSPTADGQGWRPIETAPKDGSNVLLVNRKGNIAAGSWLAGGWWLRGGNGPDAFFNRHHGPTHWQPLPSPPAPEGEAVIVTPIDEANERIDRLERLVCVLAEAILLKDYGKDINREPLEHLAVQNDLEAADTAALCPPAS